MDFIVISVGNELLSGDISNTNATYIARRLTKKGHKVVKMVVIPDDVNVIAEEVRNALYVDFVIVTGGLGATHDDVTTEGIAKALNKKLVLYEDVLNDLKKRFPKANETALRKVCTFPEGAEVVRNDVGVAPGYITDKILVMPGVPAEMEDVFEKVLPRFGEIDYYEDTLIVYKKESEMLKELDTVVKEFKDVQIGSYPKEGYVVIKFSGRDKERVEKAKERLIELLGL
ncbi:competence/damage-inducible protein A [Archaeoglobus profundus]|uniref:Molybdopterin binding domain protein n=1 Tax=Archaeoglobus profundus (strain DSM 5631 / JCM 9629 / NBRC 100127 / Av18) TaxID=572546 RepID=D2RDC0_ARCPA|nr:molybdopterin-binding protein [Archaeoglobus profundus]ADB58114.1 molybdopterin binding domain protein [Archaeoglobus profundus DSM 5631]